MRALTAAELMDLWDEGSGMSPSRRSLLLLSAVFPERRDVLPTMPLGWLSARLLELRSHLFGDELVCLADCPACREVVETVLTVRGLLAAVPPECSAAAAETTSHLLKQDGYTVEFRLPTPADLLALHAIRESATVALAERLIERVTYHDQSMDARTLPETLQAAVERRIGELDPLARIELALACPACAHAWGEVLHVIDFLWSEIGVLAKQLLIDVARLAHAFGWPEGDILAMSAQRRRCYLEILAT